MPRGNDQHTKVCFRGKADDFVIFVDDIPAVQRWRNDPSIPLQQVVSGWRIFVTHHHGAQGVMDGAGSAILENEFGTSDAEACIRRILERGEAQETTARERLGDRNLSCGSSIPR